MLKRQTCLKKWAKSHEDISTTEIYLYVAVGANGLGVSSPLDGSDQNLP